MMDIGGLFMGLWSILKFILSLPLIVLFCTMLGIAPIMVHFMLVQLPAKWSRITQWMIPAIVLYTQGANMLHALSRSMTGPKMSYHVDWTSYLAVLVVWECLMALATWYSRKGKAMQA